MVLGQSGGVTHSPHLARAVMRRCRSSYRIHQLLQARLPLPSGPLADSLTLWLPGTLLAWVLSWRVPPGPEPPTAPGAGRGPHPPAGPAGGPDGQHGPQPDGSAGGLASGARAGVVLLAGHSVPSAGAPGPGRAGGG